MAMTITIKDVANRAGVSLSTVSLVLNNKKNVSEKTRLCVLETIKQLNFHPSRMARGLASRKSGNIGFILTEDHFSRAEPFYTKVFLGTEFEARKHHYYVLLTTIGKDFRKDHDIPRFLLERNVDGIILAGWVPYGLIETVREKKIPFVFVDFVPKSGSFYAVLIDNVDGAYLAVHHLIEKGHRRIAFIAGDMEHPSLKERFAGYKKALENAHIPFDPFLVSADEPYTAIQNGYNASCRLLSENISFSAIFAGNDAIAQGCLRCLREKQIAVPEAVAIVGFDDIESDIEIEPHLTSVRVEKEELGAVATRRLIEMIDKGRMIYGKTLLPVELIPRRSTESNSKFP
jgi:LacI family transcriptional regulator